MEAKGTGRSDGGASDRGRQGPCDGMGNGVETQTPGPLHSEAARLGFALQPRTSVLFQSHYLSRKFCHPGVLVHLPPPPADCSPLPPQQLARVMAPVLPHWVAPETQSLPPLLIEKCGGRDGRDGERKNHDSPLSPCMLAVAVGLMLTGALQEIGGRVVGQQAAGGWSPKGNFTTLPSWTSWRK